MTGLEDDANSVVARVGAKSSVIASSVAAVDKSLSSVIAGPFTGLSTDAVAFSRYLSLDSADTTTVVDFMRDKAYARVRPFAFDSLLRMIILRLLITSYAIERTTSHSAIFAFAAAMRRRAISLRNAYFAQNAKWSR